MVIRLPQAVAAVMSATLAAGVAGGVVGAAVGTFAPSFVLWIETQGPAGGAARFSPAEFGMGLGVVSGLFFGAAVGALLVLGLAFRDAWLLRAGIKIPRPAPDGLGEV
jgi:hypothetical protein